MFDCADGAQHRSEGKAFQINSIVLAFALCVCLLALLKLWITPLPSSPFAAHCSTCDLR